MKYAKLIKLGGEYVAAEDADYEDYKGFLTCPECREPVFLRKAHQRKNAHIPDAFVHHKAVPSIELCELRVSRYSTEYIRGKNAESRGQRLSWLQANLWSILKTSEVFLFISKNNLLGEKRKHENWIIIDSNGEKKKGDFRTYIESMIFSRNDENISIHQAFLKNLYQLRETNGTEVISKMSKVFNSTFKKKNKNKARFAAQIMWEAFDVFTSAQMEVVRRKFLYFVLDPEILETARQYICYMKKQTNQIPEGFDENQNLRNLSGWSEWMNNPDHIMEYLNWITVVIFGTINWEKAINTQSQAIHLKKCLAKQSAGRGFGKAS